MGPDQLISPPLLGWQSHWDCLGTCQGLKLTEIQNVAIKLNFGYFLTHLKQLAMELIPKVGYSTKCYYCRLWDFKLVDVTLTMLACPKAKKYIQNSINHFGALA